MIETIDLTKEVYILSWISAIEECGYPANSGQESLLFEALLNMDGYFIIDPNGIEINPWVAEYSTSVSNSIRTQTSADQAIESYIAHIYYSTEKLERELERVNGIYTEEEYIEALAEALSDVF